MGLKWLCGNYDSLRFKYLSFGVAIVLRVLFAQLIKVSVVIPIKVIEERVKSQRVNELSFRAQAASARQGRGTSAAIT